MTKIEKSAAIVVLVVITTCLAAYLGKVSGDVINQRKVDRFKENRSKSWQVLSKKMTNVEIGQKIQNHYFEDLDRNTVSLASLVRHRTLLAFVNPGCYSCVEEIELLTKTISDSAGWSFFILISSGNPFHLQDLREDYNIRFPILYDHKDAFSSRFKVTTYPFNMIISDQMEIEEVISGQLTEDEIEQIVSFNSERFVD